VLTRPPAEAAPSEAPAVRSGAVVTAEPDASVLADAPPITPAVLAVDRLVVRYGSAFPAVDGLSLEVHPGEVYALLGRNGAGKTSSLRAIVGFLAHETVALSGTVSVDGRRIVRRDPLTMGRRGVVLVPERDKVFANLTVAAQLAMVAGHEGDVGEALDVFPALRRRWDVAAGLLSGGERQMLAIAMALVRRPRVLLVDELSLGLAPRIIGELMTALRAIADERHLAVVLVDQAASQSVSVADTIKVLDRGRVVAGGSGADLDLEHVLHAYLGT
jgi:branched-chain amino acid transport system ATP-binding protein